MRLSLSNDRAQKTLEEEGFSLSGKLREFLFQIFESQGKLREFLLQIILVSGCAEFSKITPFAPQDCFVIELLSKLCDENGA